MAKKLTAGLNISEMAETPAGSLRGLVAKHINEIESARRLGHTWGEIAEGLARTAGRTTAFTANAVQLAVSRMQGGRRSAPRRPVARPAARPSQTAAARPVVTPRQPPPSGGSGGQQMSEGERLLMEAGIPIHGGGPRN